MFKTVKKGFKVFVMVISAALLLAAPSYAQNVVKIGCIMNTSGPAAHLGIVGLKGIQLAVEELNKAGGISVGGKMHKVELINYDDKCSAKDAVTVTERLINSDKVPAIIGPVCSHATLAAMELTEKNKIPMISMFSASMKITSLGYKYIFRTGPQAAMQVETITRYAMEDLKVKKMALIGRNDAWSKSVADQMKKRVEARGGKMVATEFYELGSTDFYSILMKVKMANPEFIYMNSLTEDGSMLLKQARELGIKAILASTDELANEKAMKLSGKAIEGLYTYLITGPSKPYQKKYEEMYEKKYGEQSLTMDKGGWDAVMVIADAMKRAGSLDPVAIRDALSKTKKFPGMKATLSFSESGQATSDMYAGQIRNGKVHYIKEIKIFENPPYPVDRE